MVTYQFVCMCPFFVDCCIRHWFDERRAAIQLSRKSIQALVSKSLNTEHFFHMHTVQHEHIYINDRSPHTHRKAHVGSAPIIH